MKKSFFAILIAGSLVSTSCLGSFKAFNNLLEWNKNVSDSRFVNNLLFWGLNIIPVYGLFFLGDAIIFNVIEFWSGSNPIAMNEGEFETQTLVKNGNTYEMTATQNQLTINVVEGKDAGNQVRMFYVPEEETWYAETQENGIIKLSSMKDGFHYVYLPDGSAIQMDADTNKWEGMATIKAAIQGQDTRFVAIP